LRQKSFLSHQQSPLVMLTNIIVCVRVFISIKKKIKIHFLSLNELIEYEQGLNTKNFQKFIKEKVIFARSLSSLKWSSENLLKILKKWEKLFKKKFKKVFASCKNYQIKILFTNWIISTSREIKITQKADEISWRKYILMKCIWVLWHDTHSAHILNVRCHLPRLNLFSLDR
jgi:hypothetical protein